MTNFERIKAMTVDEMIDLLTYGVSECPYCLARNYCENNMNCYTAYKNYLESEVHEND